jgi:hypothetical protein
MECHPETFSFLARVFTFFSASIETCGDENSRHLYHTSIRAAMELALASPRNEDPSAVRGTP